MDAAKQKPIDEAGAQHALGQLVVECFAAGLTLDETILELSIKAMELLDCEEPAIPIAKFYDICLSRQTTEKALDRLVAMTPLNYERHRISEAKRLGMRVSIIDDFRRLSLHRREGENGSNTRTATQETTGVQGVGGCSNKCSNDRGVRTAARCPADCPLYQAGKELIESNDPLSLIDREIKDRGYAGDTTPVRLTYVASSSRYQKRPINLSFLGQPAAGKNFAADSAFALIPPEYYYKFTASSPRALVYSTEQFTNRHVIVGEADSIPVDGPAASAIRSIGEDAQMIYEVVEKNPVTVKFETRRILKAGPTGIVTTSVKRLDGQMATRMLERQISDDPEQTRQIIEAEAKEAAIDPPSAEPDNTKFFAYQHWLHLCGERRVVVLFSTALTGLVQVKSVRMRRDFRQLLSAIKAVAFLTQRQRDRTTAGAVIATLADYAKARELLADTFDSVATDGITLAIRKTVQAVKEGEEVSESDLVVRLNLSKSTVSYRVRNASRGGWLKNLENRRGFPARLVRGTPLPEAVSGLPSVEKLREAFEHHASSNTSSNSPQPTGGVSETERRFECSSDLPGTGAVGKKTDTDAVASDSQESDREEFKWTR